MLEHLFGYVFITIRCDFLLTLRLSPTPATHTSRPLHLSPSHLPLTVTRTCLYIHMVITAAQNPLWMVWYDSLYVGGHGYIPSTLPILLGRIFCLPTTSLPLSPSQLPFPSPLPHSPQGDSKVLTDCTLLSQTFPNPFPAPISRKGPLVFLSIIFDFWCISIIDCDK